MHAFLLFSYKSSWKLQQNPWIFISSLNDLTRPKIHKMSARSIWLNSYYCSLHTENASKSPNSKHRNLVENSKIIWQCTVNFSEFSSMCMLHRNCNNGWIRTKAGHFSSKIHNFRRWLQMETKKPNMVRLRSVEKLAFTTQNMIPIIGFPKWG